MRVVLAFFVFVCLYFITLVNLIPGSEQERYRFVVEGLIIGMFLFWVTNMLSGIGTKVKRSLDSDESTR